MMSRKHFNKLAEILKRTEAKRETIEQIAEFCAEQNPRFDRERFIEASSWIGELVIKKESKDAKAS